MKVRNVLKKDIPLLAKQIIDVLVSPPYGEHWTQDVAEQYLETLLSFDSKNCFCIEKDGKAFGAIFFTVRPYYLGRYAVVEDVFISEKYRRNGYGKKLVEEALAALKKNGVNGVTWKVNEKADTQLFGQKMGFTELPEWRYLIKMLT